VLHVDKILCNDTLRDNCVVCGLMALFRAPQHCLSVTPVNTHCGLLRLYNDSLSLIFTARRSNASAVLRVVILSVCPSVTRVLCYKTKEHTSNILNF